ncbi:MAG TPA: hypothetical protein VG733_11235 [Chthoniobacteraceae bacterium]|nr:hypothetical protein [Chthoniobacteraceae bacterium]
MMFYPINAGGSFANVNANAAKSDAAAAKMEVDMLRGDVERLLMITESLWMILKEQHGFDDKDLVKHIVEIDMRDGKLDGRVAPTPPRKCPKCSRTLFKHRMRCIYCGEYVVMDPFER